jgi:pimeloyl-ACP methyl ester carboxylesterase
MVKFYPHPTGTVAYRTIGEGKPILLLHGFGEDSHIWDKQIEFLQHQSRLYVPDILGSGQSVVKPNEELSISSLDTMAQMFKDFVEHLIGEPVILLGHSMGGYLALAFAEKYPDWLIGLGLVHSTAFADSEEKKETRRKAINFIARYGSRSFLETAIPGLFGSQFAEKNALEIEAVVNRSHHFAPEILISYYRAMLGRPSRTEVLKGSTYPVLFVIGADDKAAPMADVLQQTHLPEMSVVHILEQTGHMSMLEQTDQLNNIIRDFIHLCTHEK